MPPRRRPVSLVLSILLAASALYLAAQSGPEGAGDAPDAEPKRVRVAKVESAAHSRTVTFHSVTRPRHRAELAFQLSGRLSRRPVEVGDRFAAGQLLAQLDDRGPSLQLAAAEAQQAEAEARHQQAERDERRVDQLAAAGAATPEELEQVRAAAAATRAAAAAAAARRNDAFRLRSETELRAPFAGTVLASRIEPGESVTQGLPVLILAADAGGTEIPLQLPEEVAMQLGGSQVSIRLPALGDRLFPGSVRAAALGAPRAGALFEVIVQLDQAGLAAGLTAEVELQLAAEPALELPVEAVVNPSGSRPVVYRLRDQHAWRVPVEVLALEGDRVLLAAELEEGSEVVVAGHAGLTDGQLVEVLR